ncbi:MAG: GNAT family N-acetyltransferase [Myxococcales bacterium]|nr:GNAT family N-acetyltransferase [Myxococcales bacterium]
MSFEEMRVRRAAVSDLPAVVALFKLPNEGNRLDLEGGKDPFDPVYVEALASMTEDNALYVADLPSVGVIGVFQLTFVRHVGYQGGLVAQVENVVVDRAHRSRGVGETMMRFAVDRARERKAFRVQLTSNKTRTRAHAFYERLGFVRSHEGMKLVL